MKNHLTSKFGEASNQPSVWMDTHEIRKIIEVFEAKWESVKEEHDQLYTEAEKLDQEIRQYRRLITEVRDRHDKRKRGRYEYDFNWDWYPHGSYNFEHGVWERAGAYVAEIKAMLPLIDKATDGKVLIDLETAHQLDLYEPIIIDQIYSRNQARKRRMEDELNDFALDYAAALRVAAEEDAAKEAREEELADVYQAPEPDGVPLALKIAAGVFFLGLLIIPWL